MKKFNKKDYESQFTNDEPIKYLSRDSRNKIAELTNRYNDIINNKTCEQDLKKQTEIYKKNVEILKEIYDISLKLKSAKEKNDIQTINKYETITEMLSNKLIKLQQEQTQLKTNELNKIKKEIDNLQNDYLSINPVLVKDYHLFYQLISVLLIEKNKINDPNIISMKYLDFLFYSFEHDENGKIYIVMLLKLFNLCCGIKETDIQYRKENNHTILLINNIKYDRYDFDLIKQIICYQNMPDYNDDYINPEIEEELKEIERLKRQRNGTIQPPTLEKQMAALVVSTSYKYDDLKKMTIRKFIITLRQADEKLHYQIYKTGEMGGMVKFKEDVPHWIYGAKDDKFKGNFVELNTLKNKMSSGT